LLRYVIDQVTLSPEFLEVDIEQRSKYRRLGTNWERSIADPDAACSRHWILLIYENMFRIHLSI
jgi:hypothetical protein